jgi:ACS family tartrate transporter-like MFS transporter
MTISGGEGADARAMRKVLWRLVPFLGLLYFVSFLDRVNVGFAALTMNADLGLTPATFGLGSGIFFVGYALFEVPSNLVLERVGARRWIARIMVSWGLVSACMALVQGPDSFYALRFLLGIAEAGFFPGILLYLTYWVPWERRGRILGTFMLALPVSSAIGAPVSAALLGMNHLGLEGWQWMFLLEGLPAILLGIAVLRVLPDRPRDAGWLAPDERDWLESELAAERASIAASSHASLRAALADGRVWALSAIYFCVVTGLYGLGFWLPQILKGLGGWSNLQVGFATALPYAAAAAAMVAVGGHSDRTGERRWHTILPAVAGAFALAASAYPGVPPLAALATLAISSAGIYAVLPSFWTLPMAMLTGSAAAGGIALINSVGNLGGFLGPVLIGFMQKATGGYGPSLAVLAALLLLAAAITHRMHVPRPRNSA